MSPFLAFPREYTSWEYLNLLDHFPFFMEVLSLDRFGMFVDVGAKRDGLVHVKDISKEYFINNHQSVSAATVIGLQYCYSVYPLCSVCCAIHVLDFIPYKCILYFILLLINFNIKSSIQKNCSTCSN